MKNIEADIEKAGGWYSWRDYIILENQRGYSDETKKIMNRINNHRYKNRQMMDITKSKLK